MKASPEHGEAIAAAFSAARRQMTYLPDLHTIEEERAFILERVLHEQAVHVALVNGQVVGFLAGDTGWIDHLYVHPGHTGRGVGSLLLKTVMAGASELQLWTFQQNGGARRFYEKHGFRVVEQTDGTGNMERLPDMRYVWSRLPAQTDTGLAG